MLAPEISRHTNEVYYNLFKIGSSRDCTAHQNIAFYDAEVPPNKRDKIINWPGMVHKMISLSSFYISDKNLISNIIQCDIKMSTMIAL